VSSGPPLLSRPPVSSSRPSSISRITSRQRRPSTRRTPAQQQHKVSIIGRVRGSIPALNKRRIATEVSSLKIYNKTMKHAIFKGLVAGCHSFCLFLLRALSIAGSLQMFNDDIHVGHSFFSLFGSKISIQIYIKRQCQYIFKVRLK
jgi:hypothetical protein